MLDLKEKQFEIITVSENTGALHLKTGEEGGFHTFHVVNSSGEPAVLREVVVHRQAMGYPANTRFYAEGSNMLSQYWGTIGQIQSTVYTDRLHYRFPVHEGLFSVCNLIQFFPDGGTPELAGFTSCRRFTNEIRFNMEIIEFVIDCDNITIPPHDTLELEELFVISEGSREEQLAQFAERIVHYHPRPPYDKPLTGWCSWYCYGPGVRESDIEENCRMMKKILPGFRFVQIDDGYQKYMGDWLIPHPNFPGGVQALCGKIRKIGLEPAIWVAPFIAEEKSELFRKHPDCFVRDDGEKPLSSAQHSFGGWRSGPWYMLDGSHPEACEYLYQVFRTMREEWGCTYFKLDANLWGCMPWGKRFDSCMTRTEAYRQGMAAIRRGAGPDAVILGCNAPLWPSLGTCTAMRVTSDISRRWDKFDELSRECFSRNWQNGKLWINDPDCFLLENLATRQILPDGSIIKGTSSSVSVQEFDFHRTHILASGGALLSGDILTDLREDSLQTIEKLLQMYGKTARFDDMDFLHGTIPLEDGSLHCYFNRAPQGNMVCLLPEGGDCIDFWSGETIPKRLLVLPPCSARVIHHRPYGG